MAIDAIRSKSVFKFSVLINNLVLSRSWDYRGNKEYVIKRVKLFINTENKWINLLRLCQDVSSNLKARTHVRLPFNTVCTCLSLYILDCVSRGGNKLLERLVHDSLRILGATPTQWCQIRLVYGMERVRRQSSMNTKAWAHVRVRLQFGQLRMIDESGISR